MRLLRLTFPFLLALLLGATAHAQSARWEKTDEPGALVLTFENCSPEGTPTLPTVNGATFALTDQATRMEIVNFRRTDYVQLTYRMRASSSAPVTIPAFDVKT